MVNNNESFGKLVTGKTKASEVPNNDVDTVNQAKNVGGIDSVDLDSNLGL